MKNNINQIKERLKDLKASNPTTIHPIDFDLQSLGYVFIKDGLTYLNF